MVRKRQIKIGNFLILIILFLLPFSVLYSEIIINSYVDNNTLKRGESFTYIISIEGKNEKLNFSPESLKFPSIKGLKVLNRYSSSSHSYSFINGKTSSSEILKISYLLVYLGDRKKIIIPKINLKVNKKLYQTNEVEVYFEDSGKIGTGKRHEDYFIDTAVSKVEVYEFEPLFLNYTLYIKPTIRVSNINLMEKENFNNFFVHSIYDIFKQRPENIISSLRKINGVNYREVPIYKYEVAPSKTGKLKLPSISLQGIISRPDNFFNDDFFSFGRDSFVPKRVIIISQPRTINVKPLPPLKKGKSFSGIVSDNLKLSSKPSKIKAKTGEGITYTITLDGKVFKDFLKPPTIIRKKYFEIYEPEIKTKGNKTIFKYLIIPKISGNLELPKVSFTYFDIKKNKYITLENKPQKIAVEKGEESLYFPAENGNLIKIRSGDIYFLKPIRKLKASFKPVFYQTWFWLIIFLSVSLFFIKLLFIYKERRIQKDKRLRRKIVASKMAKKWRKEAKKSKEKDFFAFAYNFLFEYLINKFGIDNPAITVEQLIKTIEKETEPTLSEDIKNIFNMIERAKFSPDEKADREELIYKIGLLIDRIERG